MGLIQEKKVIMENKNSTNEAQEITLEQLDEATGGVAAVLTLPASVRAPLLTPRLPQQLDFSIGTLRDPGLVSAPARPRLLDSVPADLISLVENL
jgi:hypothetical protein